VQPTTALPATGNRATRRPLGVLAGALRVFDFAVGQMLWSRRTIFMALVVGLPVLVSAILRVLPALGVPVVEAGVTGPVLFGLMFWAFCVRFAVPVLAMFYGAALIADEVEDRTITYLFIRPIPRASVVIGKYLAFVVVTMAVMLPAVVLMWLLIVPIDGSLGASFPDLLLDLVIVAGGLMAYGALFAAAGAWLRRPIVIGLIFIFGWENLAMALPGHLRRLTVGHYVQGLVPHTMPSDSPLEFLRAAFQTAPAAGECVAGLLAITAFGLWLAARAVSRREYVLEH
jgi:hypothetical protein